MFTGLTPEQVLELLFNDSSPAFRELMMEDFSFGQPDTLDVQRLRPAAWANPLESVLPSAPGHKQQQEEKEEESQCHQSSLFPSCRHDDLLHVSVSLTSVV